MNPGFGDVGFIECSPSGHRPRYVELVASRTDARFLLSAAVFDALSPPLRERLRQEGRVRVLASCAHEKFLDELTASLAREDADLRVICFLMLDDYLGACPGKLMKFVAAKRPQVISALLMDSTFCYPTWRSPKGWARLVLRLSWMAALGRLAPRLRVFALDDRALSFLRWVGFRRDQLCAVPDPALVDHARAGAAATRPGSVLLFGRHTPRKGTAWALAALSANTAVREIRLVGEIVDRPAIEDALARLPAETVVTTVDRIVSDEEAEDEFARAAVVATPYEGFGSSSNVILNAWCFGKRTVCPAYGLMARLTRRYGGGFLYRPRDAADFNRAVSRALSPFAEGESAALRAQVTGAHSREAFILALQRGVQPGPAA